MLARQPFEVLFDAGPAEIVDHQHRLAIRQQVVGEVRSYEAAAADDGDRRLAAVACARIHVTSPRSSSSRFMSAPRSTADVLRTQETKSSSEFSNCRVGSKPSSSRAFEMSAKQLRMSPERALPSSSGERSGA